MFSRSSPRPYRRATRRQGQWPRCWFTSGSSAMGYPRKSTVTRVGTLSLSWWNPFVSSMASRRPGPLHTTPVATRSASDSIARCMICFEPCPRNRNPSGHSTSRSSCSRITIRLTLPPGFRPTSFCSATNRSYQLTTCLGAQPRPRLDPPTGYDSIGCACRLHTPGHWSISKKLQRRDESRRTRKLPITHYTLVTWFTWETVSSAGARSKTDGVLNCTSWPHVPTPAYMCMGSNHSLAGRSGPSVEMTCCLPGHHWLLPQRSQHGKHLLRPTHITLIGWVLAGSACDCWLASCCTHASFRTHSCCPHSSWSRSCCTHSCSWRTAIQSQTCTQAFHLSEQRGKPQCCPHSCWSRSRCTHSCSWRTAIQSQTCTQALHPNAAILPRRAVWRP